MHYPSIPVEVVPAAVPYVMAALARARLARVVRAAGAGKAGPVVTDNGNQIVDVLFPKEASVALVEEIADKLTRMVGVVAHGLFTRLDRRPDAAYLADSYAAGGCAVTLLEADGTETVLPDLPTKEALPKKAPPKAAAAAPAMGDGDGAAAPAPGDGDGAAN